MTSNIDAQAVFNSYPGLHNDLNRAVTAALEEDIGQVDWTGLLIDEHTVSQARIIVREDAILCGKPWAQEVLRRLVPQAQVTWHYEEGAYMRANTLVCELQGNARALMTAERSVLNFIQLLSAVATKAHRYAVVVKGTRAKVLDTRKTIPGLRLAQKYAVKIGGGENQRLALYDGILIKENHIAAAGGITAAVEKAVQVSKGAVSVQVEVENLKELEEALSAGAHSILLDNFDLATLREAVAINNGRALLEASGGVNEQTLRAIAETGVDRISIGGLTKDIEAVDFSMRVVV